MNRTLIFASIGALATALLVAMLLSALMGGSKTKEPVKEILVANQDISIGSTLNSGNARWQKWPNGASVPGALFRDTAKEEEWKDQKVRRSLTKDEPITEGALVREIKGSYLAAALEPGMRAMTIDVQASSGVAGFISPGDHVDVILTYNVRVTGDGNSQNKLQELVVDRASETILQNLRVLATDQDAAGSTGSERQAKLSKTITVEVTKEGAEKLALATQLGNISLAMRQLGDNNVEESADHPVTDVTTGKILERAVKMRNSADPSAGIRVYTNNGVQIVPVNRSMESENKQ